MKTLHNARLLAVSSALALAVVAAPAFGANIIINNVDPPGIGFNDPTPVAPIDGNPGTTLGEQRRIVFEFAADLWGAVLDSPVDIVVQATFSPLACTPTSGTLGAAGTIQVFAFGAAPPGALAFTWYPVALANKLAGVDLAPGPPDPGLLVPPFADDIVAFFNGAIGVDPNCLTGLSWYHGLTNNAPPGTIDLLNVVMHEFGHGLGFANFINETTGQLFGSGFGLPLPDIYSVFTFDNTLGLTWAQMTDAQRVFSAVNTGNVVWNGANVTAQAPAHLSLQPVLNVKKPKSIAGNFIAQPAAFGPAFPGGDSDSDDSDSDSDSDVVVGVGLKGKIALADDGVGAGGDGCQAIVSDVDGKIALIDRGGCAFTVKVANAQAAGAEGAIVANNVPGGGPAPMGGSDPSIVIPSIGISLEDGDAIKAELAAGEKVKVAFGFDPLLLAGADASGQVKLYAPNPVQPGSSISHWDVSATPNLLMEPFNTPTIRASENLDLTPALFLDEGWMLVNPLPAPPPPGGGGGDSDSDSDSD
ncbi:MAG: peptidase [Acidobacteria bacterium]|nr:MAG: peptidase [Acidobacteriota bacterium]